MHDAVAWLQFEDHLIPVIKGHFQALYDFLSYEALIPQKGHTSKKGNVQPYNFNAPLVFWRVSLGTIRESAFGQIVGLSKLFSEAFWKDYVTVKARVDKSSEN